MSKANSPSYAQGRDDALADNDRIANGEEPVGPQPPNPDYPWMYLKGYEDHFIPALRERIAVLEGDNRSAAN